MITTLIGLIGWSVATPASAQASEYIHPVDGEIVRPFEPPSHEFGPGHRGIDYGVASGTPVRASGEGTVKFAGPVGGQGLFVTLQHAGDIQTTYSYLSSVDVARGDQISQGQLIAHSGAGHPDGPPVLHFGAKRAGQYIDPLTLIGDYRDISELLKLERIRRSRATTQPDGRFGSPGTSELPFLPPSQAVPLVTGPTAIEPFASQGPPERMSGPEVGSGPRMGSPNGASASEVSPPDAAGQDENPGGVAGPSPVSGLEPFLGPDSFAVGRRARSENGPHVNAASPLTPLRSHDDIPLGKATAPSSDSGRIIGSEFGPVGPYGPTSPFDVAVDEARIEAKAVRDWWEELPESERERLIEENPDKIRDKVGVPLEARDRANRIALDRRVAELEEDDARIKKMWAEAHPLARAVKWISDIRGSIPQNDSFKWLDTGFGIDGMTPRERELAGARALSRQLESLEARRDREFPDSDIFLLGFDTAFANGDGMAVVSIGDPRTAGHLGRVIPGINNELSGIEGPLEKIANIQEEVALQKGQRWAARNSSVIAWLGYDTPNGVLDAFTDNEARPGAQSLLQFTRDLLADRAREADDPQLHDSGHSYGSSLLGLAVCSGMPLDDALMVGSPGAGCSARAIRRSAERVWGGSNLIEPIHLAALIAPLGPNPAWDAGFERLPLDSLLKQSWHGSYFDPETVGLANIVRIHVGDHEQVN